MNWQNQDNNSGTEIKLLVYFFNGTNQTYWAFLQEEKKGTAISGLIRRILNGKAAGLYKLAIFYNKGVEVQRWENGIRIN